MPNSYITPPLTPSSHPTLKQYKAMPTTHRSFCSTCGKFCTSFHLSSLPSSQQRTWCSYSYTDRKTGSSLTFNDDGTPEVTEIYLGTVDQAILTSRVGTELVGGAGHIWMENAVPGVTDGLDGKKFLKNREDGEMVG
jgi:hypothetical protein